MRGVLGPMHDWTLVHPIRLGEDVTQTEPDGSRLPFRVASLAVDTGAPA